MAGGLQLALSNRQWEVETDDGRSPDDVVEHAKRFEPDCVLLDTHLRHDVANGIELIAPLAASGIQVIMLTAERRRSVLVECLEAGAVGWIGVDSPVEEVDATSAASDQAPRSSGAPSVRSSSTTCGTNGPEFCRRKRLPSI